jgi:hypothetical protein
MKTNKVEYCIASKIFQGVIKFWCGDFFRSEEDITKYNYKIKYYTKNDAFHKCKELRKGYTKEMKKLIVVW